MKSDEFKAKPEKVHFRDVVIHGTASRRLVYPIRIGVETRNRPGYGQRGATRTIDDPCCIFQYTLAGTGLFEDDRGRTPLPPGTGFMCESHDPRIAYRFPEDAEDAWDFLYMSFNADPLSHLVREMGERCGRVVRIPKEAPILDRLLRLARVPESLVFMPPSEAAVLVMDLLSAVTGAAAGIPGAAEDKTIRHIQTLIQKNHPGVTQPRCFAATLSHMHVSPHRRFPSKVQRTLFSPILLSGPPRHRLMGPAHQAPVHNIPRHRSCLNGAEVVTVCRKSPSLDRSITTEY